MKLEEALGRFKKIKFNKLSKLEKEGLFYDLNTVYEKLKKKEYKKGFYSFNKFNFAARTQELISELTFYAQIGRDWGKVFDSLNINKFKSVVDLCPGSIPKIELGLFYSKYSGKVLLLDKNEKSLKKLESFMLLFNYNFTIRKKITNLFQSKIGSYEFVCANHVIDDLVLYYFCNKKKVSFDDLYENEEKMIKFWSTILLEKSSHKQEVAKSTAKILKGIVKSKGYICITHYKSYAEKLLSLDDASNFNRQVFTQVKAELIKYGFTDQKEIIDTAFKDGAEFLKPQNFLLLKNEIA